MASAAAATAKKESVAAKSEAVQTAKWAADTAGHAYATAVSAAAARDTATEAAAPANAAIAIGTPYQETDASAAFAVLTGQSALTLSEQQATASEARAAEAADMAAEAQKLADTAAADSKLAAQAASAAAKDAQRASLAAKRALAASAEAAKAGKAAQKAADNASGYAQQAGDDAVYAGIAANDAETDAAAADNAATEAEHDAAGARDAATAAEGDAATARDTATKAETDATAAETAAEHAQSASEEAQAAATRTEEADRDKNEVTQASTSGAAGAEDVVSVPYNVTSTASSDGFCTGTNGCDYKIDYHVTGTMLFFVISCDFPDTALAECIGDLSMDYIDQSPIDIHETRTVHISGYDLTTNALKGFAQGMVKDFTECWDNFSFSTSCAWAAAIVLPTVIGVAAKVVRAIRGAAMAGSGMVEAVSSAREAGLAAEAAAGVERTAKTAASVKNELDAVKVVAESHGYTTVPQLGKGVLWANKLENLRLMTPSHIAKLKEAGWTKDQIETVYKYYDKVRTVTPQNPSAGPRADLMKYILEGW